MSIIRPPPKLVYRIHDPKGLSILTQKRVGFSKLNFHNFKHNFRDACPTNDGVEDTELYFLLCRTDDGNRLDLLNSVNVILLPHGLINLSNEELLRIILYGHEQLSLDSNAKTLTAALGYVQPSKCFEQVGNENLSANSPLSLNSFLFVYL